MALLLEAGRSPGRNVESAPPASADRTSGWVGLAVVSAFVLSMLVPIILTVGPLRLSPIRIVLLLAFFPIMYGLVTGAWRLRTPDVFVILYAVWPTVPIVWHHGLDGGLEPAGIHIIESFSAYGLARCYIRSRADLDRVMRIILAALVALIPVGIYEAFTGQLIMREVFGTVFATFSDGNWEQRLGFYRAHGPFAHSILFGVYCASMFGMLVFAQHGPKKNIRCVVAGAVAVFTTLLSFSAGPMVALMVQFAMVIWYLALRAVPYKWWLAISLVLALYTLIDLISNRTPIEILIAYATFNYGNAYYRVHIWHYGIAEVYRHPLLGIGFNPWQAAHWMNQSMDNFYLVTAVRFGVPTLVLLFLAIFTAIWKLGRLKGLSMRDDRIRTGWAISIVGVLVAGGTVHLYDALFCHFFLLLGSVIWLLDARHEPRVAVGSPNQNASGDRVSQAAGVQAQPVGGVLSAGRGYMLPTRPEGKPPLISSPGGKPGR